MRIAATGADTCGGFLTSVNVSTPLSLNLREDSLKREERDPRNSTEEKKREARLQQVTPRAYEQHAE